MIIGLYYSNHVMQFIPAKMKWATKPYVYQSNIDTATAVMIQDNIGACYCQP